MSLAQGIKRKALELGFDLVGITDASPTGADHVERLKAWLESGYAGEMTYMHRNLGKRIDPAKLLEDARSVIVVGLNYKTPTGDPKEPRPNTPEPTGRVASYAQYQDYHPFIRQRLRELIDFIGSSAGAGQRFKICVDSAPLAERSLAVRAGLGFIGKNHMLIHPTLGPQILLGEVITTLELACDEAIDADCSGCDTCISTCPTGALLPDGQFDGGKCINYLTIEHKGEIAAELRNKIGDRVFGCEECIVVCPYHTNAPVCKNRRFRLYHNRAELDLQRILTLTDESFAVEFADSVINRLGLDRFKRNAQICLDNTACCGHD